MVAAVLAGLSALGAAAQEAPQGELVFAEGRDFVLVRGGQRRVFPIDDPEVLGMALLEGDLIQTAPRTFLEVQLLPRGTVLKIAENSSFQFKGFGAAGESVSLGLIYGRVRAKVAKMAADDSFTIRSGNTVAGVRGTDFGFDSLVAQGAGEDRGLVGASVLRVYCFSGEVALIPSVDPDSPLSAAPAVTVRGNEVASLDPASAVPLVERRSMDAELFRFWSENDFKGSTPLPPPETPSLESLAVAAAPVGAPAEVEIRYIPPDYTPFLRANRIKNGAIAASALFSLLGAAFQGAGVAYSAAGEYGLSRDLMVTGAIPLGLGIATLITALVINPPSP